MSTNGHLKFQGTNRATFVGATSNIMFDTTTTSLGIGVTGTDHPSSNLYITGNAYVTSDIGVGGVLTMGTVNVVARHDLEAVTALGNTTPLTIEFSNATTGIVASGNVEVGGELAVSGNVSDLNIVSNVNMLHTANTASIKLNSNVVTEFPRSKKLIKYPRVAIASGQSGLSGGYTQDEYTVEASSELTESGVLFAASNAFNSIQAYQSTDYAWSSGANRYGTGGLATNGTSKDTFQGIDGSWIGLTLPNAIRLDHIHLYNRAENTVHVCPAKSGIIWASNDGTLWYRISSFDNLQKTDGALNVLQVNSANFYTRYRVQITANNPDPVKTAVMIGELEFYGTPEYDPEAHGTDVTVKSYPNVPNTDFLDVFVDAGNTSGYILSGSSVTSVADLSPPANTMSVTGVTYDSTNKAFVFSGSSSSYIKATLQNGNGNYAHTLSAWFMMTDYSANWRTIIALGTNTPSGEQSAIAYDPDQDRLYFGTYGADIYVPHKPELYKWYHVAATFSGGSTTSTTMNIYLNGVNMGGVPDGTQTPSFTGDQLCIGGAMNTNGTQVNNPFKGQIANARFYRRAYTSDEIYQLYAYQKEYFGHGDLSMTLKAGRLGIGTSEPRAMLDVRGASIRGPLSTFLSHDDTLQTYTNMPTAGTEYLIKSVEFEIPEVYRSLGNVNLQANSTVKWMGEMSRPYNAVFRLYIEYPKGLDGVITVSTGAYLGWNTRFGHGNPAISYADSSGVQFANTPETAIIATGHTLEGCRCNISDKLTVKLYAACEDEAQELYTNQTQFSDNAAYNERGNTNFFIALKVV